MGSVNCPHDLSNIKHVVAIMSGKGGVEIIGYNPLGLGLKEQGFAGGVLDADITGPSIPRMFGIDQRPEATEMVVPLLGVGRCRSNVFESAIDHERRPCYLARTAYCWGGKTVLD